MEIQGTPEWSGYDRAITVFSPDGRLVQVEYAHKAVDRANLILGIVFKDGVLLMADKSGLSPLHIISSYNKIAKIDDHLAMVSAGIGADGRVLIDRARIYSQRNRMTFREPISPGVLTKRLCDDLQKSTQLAGLRPYGVVFFIAGMNNEPELFEAEPSGVFWQIKAGANGRHKDQVEEIFKKEYKDNLSKDAAFELAIDAMKRVQKKDFKIDSVEAVIIEKGKDVQKIPASELKKFA